MADGEILASATTISTAANELTAGIHSRMPAILAPDPERVWLDQCLW